MSKTKDTIEIPENLTAGLTEQDRKATMRGRPAGPPPGVAAEKPPGLQSGEAFVGLAANEQLLVDAESLLLRLEARCANGGSAGLADIRRVLAALRGEGG